MRCLIWLGVTLMRANTDNEIESDGAIMLSQSLAQLTDLTQLDLSCECVLFLGLSVSFIH